MSSFTICARHVGNSEGQNHLLSEDTLLSDLLEKHRADLKPVGCLGRGTFDWLTDFLEQHPGYVEISAAWPNSSCKLAPRSSKSPSVRKVPSIT